MIHFPQRQTCADTSLVGGFVGRAGRAHAEDILAEAALAQNVFHCLHMAGFCCVRCGEHHGFPFFNAEFLVQSVLEYRQRLDRLGCRTVKDQIIAVACTVQHAGMLVHDADIAVVHQIKDGAFRIFRWVKTIFADKFCIHKHPPACLYFCFYSSTFAAVFQFDFPCGAVYNLDRYYEK